MDWHQIFAARNSRMKASEIRELLKLLDQPDIISFAGGIPDPALFPAEAFQEAFADALSPERQATALQYSVSEGYGPLRDWIVGEMGRLGVPCSRDNILITSGSQQALDYLGKLLLNRGDTALVGWPTYLGALGAFNAYEPRYDRLDPETNRSAEDYAQAAGEGRVKFAYMSVDFANPTGRTLDAAMRERVIDLADALDIAVIEDAAYQSLRYEGEALAPVLAREIARKGDIDACRTLYCGSFSKTLAPGLRVGWVCGARDVISAAGAAQTGRGSAQLHHQPDGDRHGGRGAIRCACGQDQGTPTAPGATAMLAALTAHMPEGVSWTRPEGGMFIWLELPRRMNCADLLAQSLKTERVAFVPGHAFFADGSGTNTTAPEFQPHRQASIDEGIARLGRLITAAL